MRPDPLAILRVVPSARVPVAALGLLGVLSGVAALGQTLALASLTVHVVRGEDLERDLVLVAVAFGARAMLAGLSEATATWAGARVSTRLRRALLSRWLQVPSEGRPPEAEGFTLATQGVTSVEPYVARYLPAMVTGGVVPLLAIGTLFVVDWVSALIVLLTVPLLPVFAALIGMETRAATEKRWASLATLSGHFLDVMRGLPTLVGYGRAERQVAQIRDVGHQHRRATMKTLRLAFLSSAALELLATISVAIVAVAVGLRLAHGTMDLHVGLTAILLAPEAYWPIRRVGAEFHSAADGQAALADAQRWLDGTTRHTDSSQPVSGVTVEGLSYAYPGTEREVLTGLTVSAPPTGLVMVTGPSGTGKTTLLELIAGLRTPTSGTVRSPRAHLVTQRPYLAPATLADNLRLSAGGASASDDDLRTALTLVGLEGLIPRLEERLGDEGFGLSAGQRARVALARAYLDNAPVILLDEPTAHLDDDASASVRALVSRMAQGRLVIMVTHREDLDTPHHWRLEAAGVLA